MTNHPRKTIILQAQPAAGVTRTGAKGSYETGLLLNFNSERRGGLSLDPILILSDKGNRNFQRIPESGNLHLTYLSGLPPGIAGILRKLTDEFLLEHLVKKGFAWVQDADDPFGLFDDRHYAILRAYTQEVLWELKPLIPLIRHLYYLRKGEHFSPVNIRPAYFSSFTPALTFSVEKEEGLLRLETRIRINQEPFPLEDFETMLCFLRSRSEFFLLNREDLLTLQELALRSLSFPETEKQAFLSGLVKPLSEKYPVNSDAILHLETIDQAPSAKLYVSELNENFLLIKPKWSYGVIELEEWGEEETVVERDDAVYRIIRKQGEEQVLVNLIKELHPKFEGQRNGYFYLSFQEALEKNWFLRFYQAMQERDIPILGMQYLRKFKYNTHTPKLEIQSVRGIDWFDLLIEVSYGDQRVSLGELRKAILSRQEYILLEDGSLGILPAEWLEKFTLMMKMGQLKEGRLKISHIHWNLLDECQEGLDNRMLQNELEEKRRRLRTFETSNTWPLPAGIKANLRDYQQAGFQWMCLLGDMGWGGCLADDMGLGKTLQTICFLQHLIERYPSETHLVVCPTSLLYNWESELKKFAPGLPYHIHYGMNRMAEDSVFSGTRLIITSYGMIRSDIEQFSSFQFGYIVLDESQAIKNPASQVFKAVQRLNARNRLALSGTPVQNNTFDLYAQMHFLNPGILGGQDFFRTEFANPIDRNGDKLAAARLRRLVYPFLLRRTKEQVAGDLPDKTEMILWCEMSGEQRKIYDRHKEYYRERILEKLESDGIGRSSIFILQGLTRLRQICDSPALLKERLDGDPEEEIREGNYPNTSAKLEELVWEIEENMGDHKALVFSQFTSMLQLIREELGKRGIPHLYLDGSVSATGRKESVGQFQEQAGIRVFLISLKAGGVGLNLTAADYVYLVDPWWNPASEQQAIDRSHRIGQSKKVFAYRMICKDTVEEKILQLQEKKKNLAADLISDEAGFVKTLTQEDIGYLFS